MKRFATSAGLAAACAIAAALAAPVSAGLHLNGPSLDGQEAALPDGLAGSSEAAFAGLGMNGPSLDGQKVALPGGPARAIR
jgi:hypothetical protein